MNKNKIEFSKITKANERVTAAATIAADCEAKIVLAERAYEKARRDDGVSAPSEIFKRGQEALRELEILKIEGNRAAAKLAEAEGEFAALMREHAQPICDELREISQAAKDKIIAESVKILGEAACGDSLFRELLMKQPQVAEPFQLARNLQMCIDIDKGLLNETRAPLRDDLVSNILSAARFF